MSRSTKRQLRCALSFFFFFSLRGDGKKGGIPPHGSFIIFQPCLSLRTTVLFISSFFFLKNIISAASEDPYPDKLFTLQANISVFIALLRIDTFESNYLDDSLQGQVVCFDGIRQEN